MYRHEAIALARKMMQQAGVTDELHPWVVDAVLRAANTRVPMVEMSEPELKQRFAESDHLPLLPRKPVAWRCATSEDIDGTVHYDYLDREPRYHIELWQPLYAE